MAKNTASEGFTAFFMLTLRHLTQKDAAGLSNPVGVSSKQQHESLGVTSANKAENSAQIFSIISERLMKRKLNAK